MISYFIKVVKKIQFNRHLKNVNQYLKIGDSHFLESFKLILNKPTQCKIYLQVGDDSMLSCKINFESESGQVIVGNNCFIGHSRIICKSKIEFGNNVFVAWDTYFYDHNSHSLDYKDRENDIVQQLNDFRSGKNFIENKNWNVVVSQPIKVCDNAWIGMNCIILKGVVIGEGSIVGAGSVVTKDVPAWSIVAGNPARVVKEIPIELRKK